MPTCRYRILGGDRWRPGDMISMLMSSYITVIKKIFATSNMKKIVICKDRWWCFDAKISLVVCKKTECIWYDVYNIVDISLSLNMSCQEQITKISNLSIHIHKTIIIFEIYVLQLIFRERDISTILDVANIFLITVILT